MKVRLEALGAQVVKVGPKADLLVLGEAWGFDGIDALDAGVPAVFADGLDALEAGAPLSDFVAPRGAAQAMTGSGRFARFFRGRQSLRLRP